tara:strand:+ start:4928 stop:5398 length:471 start_codon:yes stop_codon:yes gene_type:complete
MTLEESEHQFKVVVSKDVPAPVDTVFWYFTAHAFWEKWWIHTLEVYEGNADAGGKFRIKCEDNRADVIYTVSGFLKAIARSESMIFSWTIEEPQELADETCVTVTFSRSVAGTLVTVCHAGFMSREAAILHDEGWEGGLNKACYFIMRLCGTLLSE